MHRNLTFFAHEQVSLRAINPDALHNVNMFFEAIDQYTSLCISNSLSVLFACIGNDINKKHMVVNNALIFIMYSPFFIKNVDNIYIYLNSRCGFG
jgi:hypothetical protein